MADIVDFKTKDGKVGDGYEFDPDQVLKAAKGKLKQVLVCGWTKDGEFYQACSHGSREALWMLRKGEFFLLYESD